MTKYEKLALVLFVAALAAPSLFAAAIDGTWILTRQNDKGEVKFDLKLKGEGSALTGTYGRRGARRNHPLQDGKVSEEGFSFSTTQRSKKGEFKMLWKGKVVGDEIQGEAGRGVRDINVELNAVPFFWLGNRAYEIRSVEEAR